MSLRYGVPNPKFISKTNCLINGDRYTYRYKSYKNKIQKKLTWQREAVCLTFWPSSFAHCMDADDNYPLKNGRGGCMKRYGTGLGKYFEVNNSNCL